MAYNLNIFCPTKGDMLNYTKGLKNIGIGNKEIVECKKSTHFRSKVSIDGDLRVVSGDVFPLELLIGNIKGDPTSIEDLNCYMCDIDGVIVYDPQDEAGMICDQLKEIFPEYENLFESLTKTREETNVNYCKWFDKKHKKNVDIFFTNKLPGKDGVISNLFITGSISQYNSLQ